MHRFDGDKTMATPVFNMRYNITAVDASVFGGADYKLTGFVFDESNNFDGDDAAVGDVIYDFNGNKYLILNFVSQSPTSIEVDVEDLDSQIPNTGSGVVSRPSTNFKFAVGSRQTNGVSEFVNQYIDSTTLQQIDSKIYNTNTFVEERTVTSTDISNGYLVLNDVPSPSKVVTVQVVGGPIQSTSDFSIVSGDRLTWSGDFAATIEENDMLIISYSLE